MEQVIALALQTCCEYAQKSACVTLNEFEMQLYESCARACTNYFKQQFQEEVKEE